MMFPGENPLAVGAAVEETPTPVNRVATRPNIPASVAVLTTRIRLPSTPAAFPHAAAIVERLDQSPRFQAERGRVSLYCATDARTIECVWRAQHDPPSACVRRAF